MATIYNKLVRDKIPEIIEGDGKIAKIKILNKAEYLEALMEKLGEEYAEFKIDQSIDELADMQEVVLALADALNIRHSKLAKVMSEKALKRGAFKKRIFLESVEE